MQTTLFDKFGIVKPKSYYSHNASTPFEKVIEAFYYFNKSKKSKESCYKEGVQLWKDLKKKGNEEQLRNYLKSHTRAIENSQGILAYFCLVSFLHATIKNWCFCLNSPSLILGKREKT